jgi:hypothetical protein
MNVTRASCLWGSRASRLVHLSEQEHEHEYEEEEY